LIKPILIIVYSTKIGYVCKIENNLYLKINIQKIFKNIKYFIKKIKKITTKGIILKNNIEILEINDYEIYNSNWYLNLNNIYNYNRFYKVMLNIDDLGKNCKTYSKTLSVIIKNSEDMTIVYDKKDIILLEKIIWGYLSILLDQNIKNIKIFNYIINSYEDFEKISKIWKPTLIKEKKIIIWCDKKGSITGHIVYISLNDEKITKIIYY